jgi:hypothetical protein
MTNTTPPAADLAYGMELAERYNDLTGAIQLAESTLTAIDTAYRLAVGNDAPAGVVASLWDSFGGARAHRDQLFEERMEVVHEATQAGIDL